jgi:tetratricopeptide (TPR) repeat protein
MYTGTWKNSELLSLNVIRHYPYAANAQDQLARIYEKRGWAQQAALRYEEAYRANPTLWRRAKMNAARGETERAMEDFQAASAAVRQPGLFYEDWGLFYLYLKRYGQAKDIFETALKQDPFNPNLYNNLAGALFYMQEPERAEVLWEKALELNPQFSDAYNNLGFVYEMRGRTKLAEQFYETALRHDPAHMRAARNLKRLRESKLKDPS